MSHPIPRKSKHADRVWELIQAQPGISVTELSKGLGVNRRIIDSVLATCENHGYLISEDGYRNLWAFRDNSEECEK